VIRAIGVVVPAHDEEDLLPACLASLRCAERALPSVPVYLVVVADSCRDRTVEAARTAEAAVVTITASSAGAARAAGMREILRRTQYLDPAAVWLATTDADTVVPPGWLRQQTRYADEGWDAVVGTVRVADWSAHSSVTRSLFRDYYDGRTSMHGPHPHVHGANLGFRACAYLKAGGFPDVATGEDHALVASLTAHGSRVLRTRSVTVITSARKQARAPQGFSTFLGQLDTALIPHPSCLAGVYAAACRVVRRLSVNGADRPEQANDIHAAAQ
jgi:cellulose synthase/poly-beta-1,6-N-acetylglucosamine synthase-like glycosyltransferase